VNLPASRPSVAATTWAYATTNPAHSTTSWVRFSASGTVWGSVEQVCRAGGAGGIPFRETSGGGTPFDGLGD
jgi:hypothetical protein